MCRVYEVKEEEEEEKLSLTPQNDHVNDGGTDRNDGRNGDVNDTVNDSENHSEVDSEDHSKTTRKTTQEPLENHSEDNSENHSDDDSPNEESEQEDEGVDYEEGLLSKCCDAPVEKTASNRYKCSSCTKFCSVYKVKEEEQEEPDGPQLESIGRGKGCKKDIMAKLTN